MSNFFEKPSSLLPVTEPMDTPEMDCEASESARSERHRECTEYVLLVLSIVFTALQFVVLYTAPAAPGTHCSIVLCRLARGLRISIPASLPTAGILFIVAPYIAKARRTIVARYVVLVCYLVGSTVGALLLQSSV